MKKLLKRVLGITASVSLLVTSSLTSWADGHSHRADDKPIITPSGDYTITLTTPPDYPEIKNTNSSKFSYGAYQIFTGTVKGEDYTTKGDKADPGTSGTPIPITDIKWGNAFGIVGTDTGAGEVSQDVYDKAIVGFVIALAEAPTGTYNYAFSDFHGFDETDDKAFIKKVNVGGVETSYLADRFVTGGTNVNASSSAADLAKVNYDKLAVAVADVLVAHQDHEWLQAFNDILGGFGQGKDGAYKNSGYISRYYAGSWETSNYKNYKIENVPAGYYMILDRTDVKVEDAAYSARMLFVVNNVTQVLKEGVPKLDKNVVRTDGKLCETEAAGVGDEVNFRLTGTLPDNYDLYLGGYQYKFTDTLSKGLTLKGTETDLTSADYSTEESFKVKVKGVYAGTEWNSDLTLIIAPSDWNKTEHVHETDKAYTSTVTVKDEIQTLEVYFPCLREISIKGTGTDEGGNGGDNTKTYTLGKDSKIYIDYTAVVNENAIVSPADGNKNKAVLTYSDNPQSYGDTDETTPDEATVYTFGLDIVKVDAAQYLRTGTATGTAALEGAKFAVVRPVKDAGGSITGWQIAKFKEIKATEAMNSEEKLPTRFYYGYYSIVTWETLKTDGPDGTTPATDTTFDAKWLENYTDTEATEVYNITSLSDGVLNISGLDDGVTYTIAETATPSADYAKINPFTIELEAAKDADDKEYTGLLESAAVSNIIDDGESFSYDKFVQLIDPKTDKTDDNGSANMLVANFKYIDLPSTGGVGTIWFYIFGVAGIALSGVLFFLSKKKVTR